MQSPQKQFKTAIQTNNFEEFLKLLKLRAVNPSYSNNWAIKFCINNKKEQFTETLWNIEKVKNLLKINNTDIFNEINKKYLQNKIQNF
jgi:hypothetical protein